MSAEWLRLVEVATPEGGAVVAVAEVYVDESGTHDGSPIMSIGGYVFMKSKARAFSKDWELALRREKIPYFHMTDLVTRQGIYSGWDMERCIRHEKQLIALIKKYASFGFAVSLPTEAYNNTVASVTKFGVPIRAYTFLLAYVLSAVSGWMTRQSFGGRVSLFFESGHQHAAQAHQHVLNITQQPGPLRGASHVFMDKRLAAPLQAADLLAWLSRNTVIKYTQGKPVRRDFLALAYDGHDTRYWDESMLAALALGYNGDPSLLPATRFVHHDVIIPDDFVPPAPRRRRGS